MHSLQLGKLSVTFTAHLAQILYFMKWISVSSANKGNAGNAYELWYNDKKLVALSFSPLTKIARIESAADNDKRLFFIEKRGFLQNKTVIRNEYGIKLGELSGENNEAAEGMIEMDGKKYGYTFNQADGAAVTLYEQTEEEERKPFLRCNLSGVIDGAAALVKKSISLHDTKIPYLLMALCWYLLKPSGNEALSQTLAAPLNA